MALILEKVQKRGLDFDLYSIVVFILSIFAVTIKLSTLPLSGLALLMMIQQLWNKGRQRSAALAGTALIILLPWFLRNIILSGYLIFPISQIDLFSFDWKYPLDATAAVQNATLWFNRFPSNTEEYVGMQATQWIPLWFHQLARGQKILVVVALLSPAGIPVYFLSKMDQRLSTGASIAFLVNYIGIFFWLFTAPILRFGYAYLFMSIILGGAPIILMLTNLTMNGTAIVSFPLVILAILFQLYILTATTSISTLSQRVFLPADYPSSNTQPCPIDHTTFYCARTLGLCSYEAFPCIPKPRTDVEMRGTSLQDGFRTAVQKP